MIRPSRCNPDTPAIDSMLHSLAGIQRPRTRVGPSPTHPNRVGVSSLVLARVLFCCYWLPQSLGPGPSGVP